MRVAIVSLVFATGVVGCVPKYDGPAVCNVDERETVLNARLSMSRPSDAFDITDEGEVFVAVTDDPAYNLSSISRTVYSLYLIEDGAEPEYAPDPDRQPGDFRRPLDPRIPFRAQSEYRVIDAEPGAYRLYSNRSGPKIDVVRCP